MSDLSAKEFADVGDPGRFMATSTTDPTAPSTNEPQREEIKGGATTTHCKFVVAGCCSFLFCYKSLPEFSLRAREY